MKRSVSAVLVAIAIVFCIASFASAAEIMLQKEIKNIVFKNDKNGQPYARVMIGDTATLNGVSYAKDVSAMAFGDVSASLKGYKKGMTLKAVATQGEYKGNKTFTILKVVK